MLKEAVASRERAEDDLVRERVRRVRAEEELKKAGGRIRAGTAGTIYTRLDLFPDFLWDRLLRLLRVRYETSIDYCLAALLAILFPPSGSFNVVPQCRLRKQIGSKRLTYFESLVIEWKEKIANESKSLIAPSAINAPPPGSVPPPLGVGLPTNSTNSPATSGGTRGLQEERVERDAWKGILSALTRLKDARETEQAQAGASDVNHGAPIQ